MAKGGKDNRSLRQARRPKRYSNKGLKDTLENIAGASINSSSEGQNINEEDVEFADAAGPSSSSVASSSVASSSHIPEDVPSVSQKKR